MGDFSSLDTAASIFGPSDILLNPSCLADDCLERQAEDCLLADDCLRRHTFSTSLPDVEEGSESSVVVVTSSLLVARDLEFDAVRVTHSS